MIAEAAGLAPVNTQLLTPRAEESFGLTNLMYAQQFEQGIIATFGRANVVELWGGIFPEWGMGRDGFMNASLGLPITVLPSTPLITNAAGGLVPAEQSGTLSGACLAKQRLWQDCCHEQRYTRLFGYIGFVDQQTSPYQFTSALSVEGFGLLRSRPQDRMGAGYYYSGLNRDFKDLFNAISPLGDVHGGEIYYNAEVTPWCHVTFDLQAVEPAVEALDAALVLGMHVNVDF